MTAVGERQRVNSPDIRGCDTRQGSSRDLKGCGDWGLDCRGIHIVWIRNCAVRRSRHSHVNTNRTRGQLEVAANLRGVVFSSRKSVVDSDRGRTLRRRHRVGAPEPATADRLHV